MLHSTTTVVDGSYLFPPRPHEHYARQVAALRAEAQQRVDTRLAQGFSTREALAYAAPLLRAARRGRALQATCLLELAAERR